MITLALQPQGILVPTGWPLLYAEEGAAIGVRWPKGMLLHGPPGCGKTLVARSVAAEFDAEVHEISAASVFGAYTGITDRQHRPSHNMVCCRMPLRMQIALYAYLVSTVQSTCKHASEVKRAFWLDPGICAAIQYMELACSQSLQNVCFAE